MNWVLRKIVLSLLIGLGTSFLNLAIVHAADACVRLPEDDSAALAPNIHKVSNHLYAANNGEFQFILERVTQDTLPFWENFIQYEESLAKNGGSPSLDKLKDPISTFKASLQCCDVADVWIAYASHKLLSSEKAFPDTYKAGDIQMSFTVLTLPDLPFSSHVGIFRLAEFYSGMVPHLSPSKGLSMTLHSFAAAATQAAYGNKHYMVTVPVKIMRKIMIKGIPGESIWVHEAKGRTRCLEQIAKAQAFLEKPDETDLDCTIGNYTISDLNAEFHLSQAHQRVKKFQDMDLQLQKVAPEALEACVNQCLSYLENEWDLNKNVRGKILNLAHNSAISIDGKKEKTLNILQVIIQQNQKELRKLVTESLEAAQKWLDSYFNANDFVSDTSPLNVQEPLNWEITTPSGERLSFQRPQFWGKNHGLDAGPGFPIVTVGFPALIKLWNPGFLIKNPE